MQTRYTLKGLMVAIAGAGLILGFEKFLYDCLRGSTGKVPGSWVLIGLVVMNLPFAFVTPFLWLSVRRAAKRRRERVAGRKGVA